MCPYRCGVSQNVEVRRPADRTVFEFKYLREFIESANALGMPDDIELWCLSDRYGHVRSLRTLTHHAGSADGDRLGAPEKPAQTSAPLPAGVVESVMVRQRPTGPTRQHRWWWRRLIRRSVSGSRLTLGDVRALVARVDELGLPTEKAQVRGSALPGGWGLVYDLAVAPASG